jgi:multidrug efflux pump subunit AcrA (membrane-fusion protein)
VIVTTGPRVVMVVLLLPIMELLSIASNRTLVVPGTVNPMVVANVSPEINGTILVDVTFELY